MKANEVISGVIPLAGGIYATLLAFGFIRPTLRFREPHHAELFAALIKLFRWGGPFLIAIGLFVICMAITGWPGP